MERSGVAGGVKVGIGVVGGSKAVAEGAKPGGAVRRIIVGVGKVTGNGWRINKMPTSVFYTSMMIIHNVVWFILCKQGKSK